MLEAYTLLGALAARTRRVQLGTLVTGVTYRNPAILAKTITTLDVISKIMIGGGGEKRTLEVIFSCPFADAAAITAVGEALGLSRQ
jgi:alkanesulfonate monooxygenase SsuD/methylene tetrahydromethanopterin reductase-like flavin-dependent oxidoreductase (luciferase family)